MSNPPADQLPGAPPLPPSTLLTLAFLAGGAGPGVPPYSARGIHQTLDPIEAVRNKVKRTVNGGLRDVSPPQMRKYKSEITCQDQEAPAIDGIWNGMTFLVGCVEELGFATAGGVPQRPVVPGSERIEGDTTYYRPLLQMMVTDFSLDRDEWNAETGWKLVLEEI